MNTFSAISDPTRRRILELLLSGSFSAGELGAHFEQISQPGLSKHLGVLRRAKLVKVSIRAQKRIYSLEQEGFDELEEWLSKYKKFWNKNLDSLQEYLDNRAKEEKQK